MTRRPPTRPLHFASAHMIRRIGLMLLWAVALVGLLLAGAFAVAQTTTGKRLIAEVLGRALSSADTTVRLTGLDGLIPFDFRLAQLRLADAQGLAGAGRSARFGVAFGLAARAPGDRPAERASARLASPAAR